MSDSPPEPPSVPRAARLPRWRWVGLAVIAAVPLAAALGSFAGGGLAYTEKGPLAETVLRVVVVYLGLMYGFRVLGKRELGQLSQFELVTLMLIPEIVSPALTRDDPSLKNALVGVCTILTVVMLTAFLVHLVPRAAVALEGRPAVLVRHGKLDVDNLNRERISPDELYSEMRQAGIERVEDVKWGILEPEGRISFIPFDSAKASPAPEPELVS